MLYSSLSFNGSSKRYLQVDNGKLFATQALSQPQKNVSEPQMGIELATFWSPVRCSNNWATRTPMAGRRLRRLKKISLNNSMVSASHRTASEGCGFDLIQRLKWSAHVKKKTSFRPVKKQPQLMLFPQLCLNELDFIPNLLKSETMNWLIARLNPKGL